MLLGDRIGMIIERVYDRKHGPSSGMFFKGSMSGTFGTESLVQLKFGAFQPVVNKFVLNEIIDNENTKRKSYDTTLIGMSI